MSILVRKIREHLWGNAPEAKPQSLLLRVVKGHKYNTNADAITKCLSTDKDSLSCWEIEDESHVDQAILALITGSRQGAISTISYVLLQKQELYKKGLDVQISIPDADTAAESLKPLHRNIVGLNYESLGKVQDLIIDCVKGKRKKRTTAADLWKILRRGIIDGKVNVNNLSEDLRHEICRKYADLRYIFKTEIEESSTKEITS